MAPLIGITARLARDVAWCPPLVGAREGYTDAVLNAGGLPVVIPPVDDMEILRGLYERMDGIILTGGVDVSPALYGEQPHPKLGEVHPERDRAELPVVRWAIAEGKPILGICRGIQMINVALGGTLFQDIGAQWNTEIDHEVSVRHECWDNMDHGLTLAEDSRLAELLGTTELEVNSLHHQAIKDLAPGLRIVGRAPDGIAEAVEGLNGSFLMGVQCHPETLWQDADVRWRNVFSAFVRAAAQKRILEV